MSDNGEDLHPLFAYKYRNNTQFRCYKGSVKGAFVWQFNLNKMINDMPDCFETEPYEHVSTGIKQTTGILSDIITEDWMLFFMFGQHWGVQLPLKTYLIWNPHQKNSPWEQERSQAKLCMDDTCTIAWLQAIEDLLLIPLCKLSFFLVVYKKGISGGYASPLNRIWSVPL